jgi:hypothetical protein
MPWTTPSFEEIKMDAEARSYGSWLGDAEAKTDSDGSRVELQQAATDALANDGTGSRE